MRVIQMFYNQKMLSSNKRVTFTFTDVLTLIALIIFAFLLRITDLHNHPFGISSHALGGHLVKALALFEEDIRPLFHGDFHKWKDVIDYGLRVREGPFVLLASLGFVLFGVSLEMLSNMQILLGVMTVLFAYIGGVFFWNRTFGFILALCVSVSPWHLAFSRFSDGEHVLATLHFFAFFTSFFYAQRTQKKLAYFLSGLMLGLCWYVYAPNQLLPLISFLFLAYRFYVEKPKGNLLKTFFISIGCLGAGFVITSIPHLLNYAGGESVPLLRQGYRLSESYFLAHGLWEALVSCFSELFYRNTIDEWFGVPNGAFSLFEVCLFLFGIFLCLTQKEDGKFPPRFFFVLALFIFGFIPAMLAPAAPFRRLMMVGFGALFLVSITFSYLFESKRNVKKYFSILLFIGFLSSQIYIYFNQVSVSTSSGAAHFTSTARYVVDHYKAGMNVYIFDTNLENVEMTQKYLQIGMYDSAYPEMYKSSVQNVNCDSPPSDLILKEISNSKKALAFSYGECLGTLQALQGKPCVDSANNTLALIVNNLEGGVFYLTCGQE